METPVSVKKMEQPGIEEANSDNGQSFATTLDAGGLFSVSGSDSVVVLDTSHTANLARCRSLEHHNRILQRKGYLRVTTRPASARFRFGDGRPGGVRRAAEIPVGIAGSKGGFTSFAPHADILALLRKGASEGWEGQLDFSRGISA